MRLPSLIVGVIALSSVVLAAGSQAFAQSFTFAFSNQTTCWDDTEGFDANFQPIPVPTPTPAGTHFVRRSHSVNTGTTTFRADGTLTTQNQSSTINTGGNTSFGQTASMCNGTFVFNPANQTLTTSSSCNFQDSLPSTDSGTTTNIHRAFQLTPDNAVTVVGGVPQLSPDTQLQQVNVHPPFVETVQVNLAGGGTLTYSRICTHAGNLVLQH